MLREDLRRLAFDYPLRAFCLAAQHGFAKKPNTLQGQASNSSGACSMIRSWSWRRPGWDGKTAFRFLNYHQRCSNAVAHLETCVPFISADRIWFTCDDSGCPRADAECKLLGDARAVPMPWWADYMDAVVELLTKSPCGEAIRRQTLPLEKAPKEAMSCECCREYAQMQMCMFTVVLKCRCLHTV